MPVGSASAAPAPASPAPAAPGSTVLHGVGVGRRGVVGPVAQVRPAPPVPADAPLLVDGVPADAVTVHARVEQASADVAAGLRDQARPVRGAPGRRGSPPCLRGAHGRPT